MNLTFVFDDTITTEIYTLSLHDALPIWAPHALSHFKYFATRSFIRAPGRCSNCLGNCGKQNTNGEAGMSPTNRRRSEEHTSELQSQSNLVCRLLLEKKKENTNAPAVTDY